MNNKQLYILLTASILLCVCSLIRVGYSHFPVSIIILNVLIISLSIVEKESNKCNR